MIWFYFELFILMLWQLPQNIIALLMIPFIGKMKLIRFDLYTFVFECEKIKGGISLGNLIFLSPELAKKEANILHELGHSYQSRYLGWLYLIIIGIPSILNAIFHFTECYYSWYTETWANKIVGLKVVKNQYGCYLYIPKKK